jgi:hypothetical protein
VTLVPKLSKNEKRLYGFIERNTDPATGTITTDKLLKLFYRTGAPANGRTVMTILLKRLKNKSKVVDGMRKVQSTEGSGRRALEVWLE